VSIIRILSSIRGRIRGEDGMHTWLLLGALMMGLVRLDGWLWEETAVATPVDDHGSVIALDGENPPPPPPPK
jgi:hypothetical protein